MALNPISFKPSPAHVCPPSAAPPPHCRLTAYMTVLLVQRFANAYVGLSLHVMMMPTLCSRRGVLVTRSLLWAASDARLTTASVPIFSMLTQWRTLYLC